jgi:hypothetical protein
MKKKNTGVEESNQGHRAKMNSSDRLGLEENVAEGWTTVLSKRSKKKLREEEAVEHCQKKDLRPRRGERRPRVDNVSPPRRVDAEVSQDERVTSEQKDSEHDEHDDAEQELDVKRDEAETNEDARETLTHKNSFQESSAIKQRKEEMEVDAALQDITLHSRPCPPRDVDPSVCAPDMEAIKRVVDMLKADPSFMPEVHLGVPSTKRRERALKRLKMALGIKHLEAERLLTASALAHTYGRENFVHALAMGKYVRNADSEDVNETHRVYLLEQLSKKGYHRTQLNMSLQDLEPSLGLLNVTVAEVQGWLARQEAAYDQQHAQAQAPSSPSNRADAKLPARATPTPTQSPPSGYKGTSRAADELTGDVDAFDSSDWDKPPAVKKFLVIRKNICQEMQKHTKEMNCALLQKAFDSQVARFPTVLQAIQLLPKACKVSCELSEILQRELDRANINLRDLELGGKLFLADVYERSTDRVMLMIEGACNRKLVEAEVERAYKRSGDANEAAQSVAQLMKDLSVPTPSWRQAVSRHTDTPRELGARYRVGTAGGESPELKGMAGRRKAAGQALVKMAARQEKGICLGLPAAASRYCSADAISTLRKMLKEDPELANLPAEQQLAVAARRVNRKIDFEQAQAKFEMATHGVKRTAGERESEDEDEKAKYGEPIQSVRKSLKGRSQQPAEVVKQDDDDGDGDPSSSGADSQESEDGDSEQDLSDDPLSGSDEESDSDDEGSSCDSKDDDSRSSNEEYDHSDGFCVRDDASEKGLPLPSKASKATVDKLKSNKRFSGESMVNAASARKRAASINSLGTPKKDETTSTASQGGNVYFGEDDLKKWTQGSEKYKQGFNWPAYIHHKQNYDNYCQFKGMHAARTFKSIIHANLIPALCWSCGLKRSKWREYEDATVILKIEKALRPSKSTDFALELKQIHILEEKDVSLMQSYTCFFEKFAYKVAEAEDANRSIKPNVVRSTFKAAVADHEVLKLWLEEVPWRGLSKAHARLLRKLREVKSWEQLQKKNLTSPSKKQRPEGTESEEAATRRPFKKSFRGTRAGKANSIRRAKGRVLAGRKGRSNYQSTGSADAKRSNYSFNNRRQEGAYRGSDAKRKHPGLDERGECWHTDKDLFECFNTPCQAPFCQRCGRHGHKASECRVPDEAPGINLKGYYQDEKKGKAKLTRPPPKLNHGAAEGYGSANEDEESNSGKDNAQRGSGRRCLWRD